MIKHSSHNYDVAVIGAGMGGLGAIIFLAQAGLDVVCIEPEPFPHSRVGESLDWSAPALFQELAVEPAQLIDSHYATKKSKVKVMMDNGSTFIRTPDYPLVRQLSGVKGDTLHVNRIELDQLIYNTAETFGVTFIWDRISRIEAEGDRVAGCHTTANQYIEAPWFIDASGRARLIARHFDIPILEYGHQKICLWNYLDNNRGFESTMFYIRKEEKYLAWVWEIPITPNTSSIGLITTTDEIKNRRKKGQSLEDILRSRLQKFSRFADLSTSIQIYKIETTTFQGFVNARSSGENWFLVGEAAALADPLTGHGVTAALRNAKEASYLITSSLGRTAFSDRQRQNYDDNVRSIIQILNYGIEAAVV